MILSFILRGRGLKKLELGLAARIKGLAAIRMRYGAKYEIQKLANFVPLVSSPSVGLMVGS